MTMFVKIILILLIVTKIDNHYHYVSHFDVDLSNAAYFTKKLPCDIQTCNITRLKVCTPQNNS